jgi:cell division septation protein DedD
MAADPTQHEADLQAQISAALARRSQRPAAAGGAPRIEPTLGLGGMGPGAERAAPRQESLLDDEPVGEIPPAPVHFQRDGEETHAPRPMPKLDSKIEKHRNWLFILLPVVGVPAVILISLFLYLGIEMQGEGVQDSAPLVAAPEGPEKVKPTNEGGLAVEGMDSAVLNQTADSQPQTTTEQLLPPPEEPMTPPAAPQATAGDGTAASDGMAASEAGSAPAAPSVEVPLTPPPATVPAANETASDSAGVNGDAATAAAPAAPAAPAASSEPAPAAQPAPAEPQQPAAAQPAEPTAPKPLTTQTATAGSYRVQLVALQSEEAATAAWGVLQKKYPDLLGHLTGSIVKIDLGAQGVFYRVQGGPLADRQAAAKLCGKLDQRGQACLVVRP